jgi:hypothetical protein
MRSDCAPLSLKCTVMISPSSLADPCRSHPVVCCRVVQIHLSCSPNRRCVVINSLVYLVGMDRSTSHRSRSLRLNVSSLPSRLPVFRILGSMVTRHAQPTPPNQGSKEDPPASVSIALIKNQSVLNGSPRVE